MESKFKKVLEEKASDFGVKLVQENEQDNQATAPAPPVGDMGMSGAMPNDASPTPQAGAEVSAPSYDKPLRELATLTWQALETDYQQLDGRIIEKLHSMKEGATTDDNKATKFFGVWDSIVKQGLNKEPTGFSEKVKAKAEKYNLDLLEEIDGAAGSGGAMNMDASQGEADPAMQTGQVDQGMEQQPPAQPPRFDKPLHYIAGLTYSALETDDTELEETARDKIYNLKAESMKNDQQAAQFFKTWDSVVSERNGVIPDDER